MSVIVTIIHIFVALALIMIVLLQTGKGADMGLAFGGGSSQTLFGTTGASTFLSKSTTVIAIVFMLTTFSLTIMWGRNESSIMSDYETPTTQTPQTATPEEKTTEPEQSSKVATPSTQQADVNTPITEAPVKTVEQPIQQEINVPAPVETEVDNTSTQ